MTNEQLCVFIQQDSTELLPILWGRVKDLCFMLCGRYYAKYAARFAACGVELCDLRQECYAAFLQAVQSFKEDKGMKFSSFLDFPIRNTAAELLGIRNKDRVNHNPLDNAVSLDKPIEAADNDNMTLADVIPDTESTEPFEQVLQEISDDHTRKILLESLGKLTEQERDIILGVYFREKSMKELAEQYKVSTERIRQIKAKAIRRLRGMPELNILEKEYEIERRLHYDSRANGYNYMAAQQQVRQILHTGEYLTKNQRREIAANTVVETDPVYKALEALGRYPESITHKDDTEIRHRAEKKLQELSSYREITYGLRQAVYYDERQKLLAAKAITRTLSDEQRATL